jgi:hypothetical protein
MKENGRMAKKKQVDEETAFKRVWKRFEPILIEENEARKIFQAGVEYGRDSREASSGSGEKS